MDGYIATTQNSLDWLLQFGDIEGTSYPTFIREVGAIAMGSTTYEWILRHQIHVDPAKPNPWPYQQPAWVFTSRSLPIIPDADIRFVRGDVRPVHREMAAAAGDKNLWIVGDGELAGQFYDHGLLDELIIQVTSVTLGSGSPLLPRVITTPPLRLKSATTYGEAFAELRYEVPPWTRPFSHGQEKIIEHEKSEEVRARKLRKWQYQIHEQLKISVVIATGDNHNLFFFHLVDKPMFPVNPARPATGKLKAERFGFPCALKWGSANFFKKR